jgi:hypothetical protein
VRIHADSGLGIYLPDQSRIMLDGQVVKILDERVDRFYGNASRSWLIQLYPWAYPDGAWPWSWWLSDHYELERIS